MSKSLADIINQSTSYDFDRLVNICSQLRPLLEEGMKTRWAFHYAAELVSHFNNNTSKACDQSLARNATFICTLRRFIEAAQYHHRIVCGGPLKTVTDVFGYLPMKIHEQVSERLTYFGRRAWYQARFLLVMRVLTGLKLLPLESRVAIAYEATIVEERYFCRREFFWPQSSAYELWLPIANGQQRWLDVFTEALPTIDWRMT